MITEEADHLTEDFNVLQENRFHCVILRLQTEAGLFFEEPFAGGLVVIVHSDYDITVAGRGLLADNHIITIEDPGLDHTGSPNLQHEQVIVVLDRWWDWEEISGILNGKDWLTSGNNPQHLNLSLHGLDTEQVQSLWRNL